MHRAGLVVLVVLAHGLLALDYDQIDLEERDNVVQDLNHDETGLQLQLRNSQQCTGVERWKCRTGCHRSFMNSSEPLPNKCGVPFPGDTCFDQPLTYAHLKAAAAFPLELQVLQNYPKCWSYLAPLVCAMHYRPCVTQQVGYGVGGINNKSLQYEVAEMWSKIRRGFCTETVRLCQDVIDAGFFPSFINCSIGESANSTSRSIFTDSCPISSPPVPFKFASSCPEPMVYYEGRVKGASPVMDHCYLKCRSDHFDRDSRLYQNIYQATIGGGLTVVFFAAFTFLHFFSVSQTRSLVSFAASQSFLSMSIWTAFWALGPLFYHEVDCIQAGNELLRRTEEPTDFLHWCVTQGMMMNFAYSSAYLWIAVIAYFGLNCPVWLRENEKTQRGWNLRSMLLYFVYLVSLITCILLQLFHLHETDGISGVCVPGLQSTTKYLTLVAVPTIVTLWIILSILLYYYACYIFRTKAIADGMQLVKDMHEYETERRRRFCEWKKIENPTPVDLKAVDADELQEAEDAGHITYDEDEPHRKDINFEKHKGTNDRSGFLDRVLYEYNNPKTIQMLVDGLEDTVETDVWKDITNNGILQIAGSYADGFARHRQHFHYSFGLYWLMGMSLAAIAVIWMSIPLHAVLIRSDPSYEQQSVRDYVFCAVNSTIGRKQTEWVHSGRPENAFVGCELPSYLPKQRASYVLFVFIILPTAPLLILVVAMAAGLCGRGGMKTIQQVRCGTHRRHLGKGPSDAEDGLELVEKKTNPGESEDEEEDDEDEVVKRPPGPSRDGTSTTAPAPPAAARTATAPSCPPSGGRTGPVRAGGAAGDGINQRMHEGADRPSTSREGAAAAGPSNDNSVASIATRLQAFIANFGSANEAMNPMPPLRDVQMLLDEMRAAGRRERIITLNHRVAMESLCDLSAFVNYNSERLRSNMDMWNQMTAVLNQLATVSTEIFPFIQSPEGLQGRQIAPEMAHLYETLLTINQVLATINPHMMNCEQWQDVNNQSHHKIRETVRIVTQGMRMAQANRGNQVQAAAENPQVPAAPASRQEAQQLQQKAAEPARPAAAQPPRPGPMGVGFSLLARQQPANAARQQQQQQQNGAQPGPAARQQPPRCVMVSRPATPRNEQEVPPQNQGSAYMETYSAAPSGFFTRFSPQELAIRVSRMSEIHGNGAFPQELIYSLILIGDIRLAGHDTPNDGERTVLPSEYPSIFGRPSPINVVTPPGDFLMSMRRRAIIFVTTLGYDYNRRGRNRNDSIVYMPPTFPDLGMTSTNELLLVRIFGRENVIRVKELLLPMISHQFVRPSPEIPEVGAFAAYLDNFATVRGFPHQREEWVHDPFHSEAPRNFARDQDPADMEESDNAEEEAESEANKPSTSQQARQALFDEEVIELDDSEDEEQAEEDVEAEEEPQPSCSKSLQ